MTILHRVLRATALTLLLCGGLVACASDGDPNAGREPKPYKVVFMPIAGAEDALARTTSETADDFDEELTYTIEPNALAQRLRDGITASRLFSELVLLDGPLEGDPDQRLAAARRVADEQSADLILRVRVNSARITDLGPNDRKYWSGISWFMIPAPIWFVNDRSYETDLEVRAELFLPSDLIRPVAAPIARPGTQDLDLWDRTYFEPKVLVIPPPLLGGDAETVSKTLTDLAVEDLVRQLVEKLDTTDIPARFGLEVELDGAKLTALIRTPRRLRSLEILVGGQPVDGTPWRETRTDELLDRVASSPGQFVYRIDDLGVPGSGRREVRVIAEDEVGVREVRTLVVGGER